MNKEDKEKFKQEFTARLVRFSVSIIKLAKELQKDRTLWAVSDQVIRSATSIGANIVEAKGASSKRDYIKFFEIALKSANETCYWLVVIREYDKTLEEKVRLLEGEVQEICKIIGTSVLTMKGKKL